MTGTSTENKSAAATGSRVIVALDVDTAFEANRVIEELRDNAWAFKIGLQLFTAAGSDFVRQVAAKHRIFLDLKFHDIPNTTAKAAVEAARLGVWMFNVHASGGREMMRRTVEEVDAVCQREGRNRPLVIGVTVLTSSDVNTLSETGIETSAENHVLRLAHLASDCRLDGVVASPLEIMAIRGSIERPNFLIVTPGIRTDSGTKDDQKRVMTPRHAVSEGADYLVIGRPILQAEDRPAELKRICEEIVAART